MVPNIEIRVHVEVRLTAVLSRPRLESVIGLFTFVGDSTRYPSFTRNLELPKVFTKIPYVL